jgi:para-nitrobenzyl esterase
MSASDLAETLFETSGGTVRGLVADGVRTFLGVPYGASTAGAGRFRPPGPVEPWAGVRDASDYGPSSWQRGAVGVEQQQLMREMLAMWGGGPEPSMSEDCLVLNVWAPAEVSEPVPVVVYLHGGGHSIGSGSWAAYDGSRLASRGDVVVVTVNHRLGVLAYCYLAELLGPEFATSGINGILDIVEALRWVRDNVGRIGGDPERVLVCGQSGGGAKVAALLVAPTSYGLYRAAGIMSAPNPKLLSTQAAAATTDQLLAQLGITSDHAEQLLTMPAERLVEAQQAVGNPLSSFAPVLDGKWAVAQPLDAVIGGHVPDVPLLIGTTRDEHATFSPAAFVPDDADDAWVTEQVRPFVGDDAERVVDAYRARWPDVSARRLQLAVATDAFVRMGSIRFADTYAAAGRAPVWMYRFDWETPAAGYEGTAPHGSDTTFFFDNLESAGVSAGGPGGLAKAMSGSLVAFAASGSPQHDGLPAWPPYDRDRRATMVFDAQSCVVDDPDGDARMIWEATT